MKIEKLRNNHKKEIIIGIILTVVIGGALTFRLTHSKYRVTQSIDLASGVINYKVPDFKIMAMYKNDGSGDISIDSMPTSGYVINEEKTYCRTSSGNEVKGKIKTISGNHVISGLNKGDKCYLYFDKKTSIDNVDDLIAKVKSEAKMTPPIFSNIATTDEGVYSTSDGMYSGTTYYWRGAATTNYVKFAGFCWRIIRINGDGTIRMIYDGATCHANGTSTVESLAITGQQYFAVSYHNPSYVGWTYISEKQRPSTTNNDGSVGSGTSAKIQIESWFKTNISDKSFDVNVAEGKYCNDREIGSGSWTTSHASASSFYYAGYTRLEVNKIPTFNCRNAGDVYTLKVGLITADEVMYAGGRSGENTSYYLYNGNYYWTMSPSSWTNGEACVFLVDSSGSLRHIFDVDYPVNIRPVINLKADTTFATGGTGSQNNPYVVR